jgi:hypothetical protein
VSQSPETTDPDDWQPATSRPGEMFTVEGRIRGAGVFARGVKNRDPRLNAYRRSMRRTALVFVGIAGVVVVIAIAIGALV